MPLFRFEGLLTLMTPQQIRVRFAPSPTGHLHIGNARTALFNWLLARHHQGAFILRIEDTDIARSTKESDQLILEDLAWLGLDYDEGPDTDGAVGPYRQSERLHLYRQYAQQLLDQGAAFHCYCTEEELAGNRQRLLDEGKTPKYSGRCRHLTAAQRRQFEAEGRKPTIRFHVPSGPPVVNRDLVRGEVTIERDMIGDFVLLRSNGNPSYNFAVVIDDALMRITHVVRGEDHLTNTSRQILLYEALGFEQPQFGHLSMILGPDHSRLSKRHGATSVSQYREQGYLPEALVNYLALLGWSPESGEEMLPRDELIRQFSLDRVSKSAAIFDVQKLNWLCGTYIRETDPSTIATLALPYYQQAGYVSAQPSEAEYAHLVQVVTTSRRYVHTLSEMPAHSALFFEPEFDYDEDARALLQEADAQAVIRAFRDIVAEVEEITPDNCRKLFKEVGKRAKVKGKTLYMAVRVAISGTVHGPELDEMLLILGKAETLRRVERTIDRFGSAET